jgi:murein DD-endopeptidase MepM/ murein hydrolase activator NlpD
MGTAQCHIEVGMAMRQAHKFLIVLLVGIAVLCTSLASYAIVPSTPADTLRPQSSITPTVYVYLPYVGRNRPTSEAPGFLTWPFVQGTRFTRRDYLGRDSVVDRNLTLGVVEPYDPAIPIGCSGGVCVVDNHGGIDIGVEVGTAFVAAAPLRITGFEVVPGQGGNHVGLIWVDYRNGYTGFYAHTRLLDGVVVGDSIERGQPFGLVEPSDIGASHLHFQVMKAGQRVDPYDSVVKPTGISLWTVYNEPQYPPSR